MNSINNQKPNSGPVWYNLFIQKYQLIKTITNITSSFFAIETKCLLLLKMKKLMTKSWIIKQGKIGKNL
jgi:hypothetical protein